MLRRLFGRKTAAVQPAPSAPAPRPTTSDIAFDLTREMAARTRPAVYLRRAWPLSHPSCGHSHLGGLPSLVDAWPRNIKTGLPLHFLAQIDCAELPAIESPLPKDGLLMFFADTSEEMIWEDRSVLRVIHQPADLQPSWPLRAPDDLPPVDHAGGQHGRGSGVYPCWPVSPVAIKSWPVETVGSADPIATSGQFRQAAARALDQEITEAIGLDPDYGLSADAFRADTLDRDDNPLGGAFPFTGAFANAVAAALGHSPLSIDDMDEPDAAVADSLRAAVFEHQRVLWTLRKAAMIFARRAAEAPWLADDLDPRLYGLLQAYCAPHSDSAHHLMLGHAQRITNETGVNRPDHVRLLVLDSDEAMEFNFRDAGVVEFWITEHDARAGRWDRAWAATAGG